MIVAGESSGELYGSLLASSIKGLWPEARVLGIGGEKMRKAGVEVVSGIAGAFGLTEAVSSYRSLRDTFAKAVAALEKERPDVAVLIDYPEFNLRLARHARRLGVPVLYYVSPQVWAWRRGRVRTIAGLVRKMAVILPFEEPIYRDAGLECEFVGHPITDEMKDLPAAGAEAKARLGLDASMPLLALLPGSRRHELKRLLPLMLGVVRRSRREFPDYGFFMPLAPDVDEGLFAGQIEDLRGEGVTVRKENALIALLASEAAVIASGTATLQAALLGTPTVVVYRVFPLTYFIGRRVIDVKYITLANLLLDKEALPELIQGRANPEEVVKELKAILTDEGRREAMERDLQAVRAMFAGRRPSERVARMAGEIAGWGGPAGVSAGGGEPGKAGSGR
ncbi:MAG: lipid-A-disaccharide synthase [Thermodesulfovibrionales bacterium]